MPFLPLDPNYFNRAISNWCTSAGPQRSTAGLYDRESLTHIKTSDLSSEFRLHIQKLMTNLDVLTTSLLSSCRYLQIGIKLHNLLQLNIIITIASNQHTNEQKQ